jgi:hypothetical protein
MEGIENIEKDNTTSSFVESLPDKEKLFDVIIQKEIINAFEDNLIDVGFDDEQIKEFVLAITSYDEETLKGILSLPKELRLRRFPVFFQEYQKGKEIKSIVADMAESARKNGYTLGYHVSNNQIIPEGNEWVVHGKELDDRDERYMAYYSLDYKNIFRANRCKWLYVVRAHIGEGTSHKRDTTNNWGRASTLPIVHQIDLVEVDEAIETKIANDKKKDA